MRKFAVITLLFFIGILFFQNLDTSTFRLLFWQFEFPIGFWVLSAFLSGLLLGYLLGIFKKGSVKEFEDLEERKNENPGGLLDEDEEFLKP